MTTIFLAIDTATPACSVALSYGKELLQYYWVAPQQHSEKVLPRIKALMAEAALSLKQIDGLVFGRGPGSFTGVRLAASIIQGLAFGLDKPVIAISSLQALAQGTYRKAGFKRVMATLDARRDEIYWAIYQEQQGLMQAQSLEQVQKPAELSFEGNVTVVGNGLTSYRSLLEKHSHLALPQYPPLFPEARDMLTLAYPLWEKGEVITAQQAIPIYIRDQII